MVAIALYGVVGTVLGFVLGIVGAYVLVGFIARTFTLDTTSLTIGPLPVILAIAVGVGVPLLAAILPIYFGTRMTAQEALVGYGLENKHQHGRMVNSLGRVLTFIPGVLQLGPRGVFRRHTRRVLTFVPGTMQLGIRNLFRKRLRALLTLLALSVSAVTFLAVQTTSYSFDAWLTHLMDTYRFDVQVVFTQPQPLLGFIALLGTLASIIPVWTASRIRIAQTLRYEG